MVQAILGVQNNALYFLSPSTGAYVPVVTSTNPAASTITQNLLPNTQWQIFSKLSLIQKPTNTGGGLVTPLSVTSNTTGNNLTTFSTSSTTGLLVGDVVACAGTGVDAAIIRAPFRVTGITANTSFSGYMAFQGIPAASHAMTCGVYTVGDLTGTTGDGPDPWQKSNTLLLWREKDPSDLEPGSLYSLALKKGANTTEYFTYDVPLNQYQQFWGRTITFGAWVYQRTQGGAGTFQLCIISICSASGTGQSYGGFQWLEVTATIPNNTNPVYVTIETLGVQNDVYYISQPMLAFGTHLGLGNYVQNKGEYIQFINHINAPALNPFTGNMPSTAFPGSGGVDYGYELDIEALTAGQIASTVSAIQTQVEFTAPTTGFIIDFGTCMCASGATFGIELSTQVANLLTISQGLVPMDTYGYYLTGTSGYFVMYTGTGSPGATVSNITIDFSGARLN